jgi:predicted secreted protein
MASSGTSILAEKGRAFLLKVDLTGVSPTVYTTVAGMRATQLKVNSNPVDITNKSSAGWREMLPGGGVEQVDITGSGIYDATSNSGMAFLEKSALTPVLIDAEVVFGNGVAYTGTWAVSDFTTDGPYNEAQTFSVTLMSHGPVIRSGN